MYLDTEKLSSSPSTPYLATPKSTSLKMNQHTNRNTLKLWGTVGKTRKPNGGRKNVNRSYRILQLLCQDRL